VLLPPADWEPQMFCAFVTDFELLDTNWFQIRFQIRNRLVSIDFKFTISSRICYRGAILYRTNVLGNCARLARSSLVVLTVVYNPWVSSSSSSSRLH
jgi:hypothetical protein